MKNIKVPREKGFIFVNPELSQWYSILAENKVVNDTILKRSQYCNELINIAKVYTQNLLGLIAPDISRQNIISTGHQPIWHHCGIWSKDVVAHKFAQSVDGIGLHLVLDHDICDTSMVLPVKRYDESWSFKKIEIEPDDTNKDVSLEFRPIPKKEYISTFLKKVSDEKNNHICNDIWFDNILCINENIFSLITIADFITYLQAIINSALKLDNLYLPVSRLCSSNAFKSFALSIIDDAENFALYYNQGINLLCHKNGHSRRNNVKCLEVNKDSNLIELPFWLVSEAGQRSSLWIKSKPGYIEIGTKDKVLGNIDSSSWDNKIAQLQELLDGNNFKLRPKAITLTLFVRLFLADIFIHGIGAKSYEPVTDYILENYCKKRLLKYGIVTSTMNLPLQNENNCLRNSMSLLKNKKHELKYNPEKYIDKSTLDTEPVASLLKVKKQKIAQSQDQLLPADIRKSAWRSISQINLELCSYTEDTVEKLESLISYSKKEITTNKVIGYREFFFGLFPEEELCGLINSFNRRNYDWYENIRAH